MPKDAQKMQLAQSLDGVVLQGEDIVYALDCAGFPGATISGADYRAISALAKMGNHLVYIMAVRVSARPERRLQFV